MELQSSLFDEDYPEYSINRKIRLIELFSGYNSQSMAMKRIGADFEQYKSSEWQVVATNLSKAIFHADDNTDYSESLSDDEVINKLVSMGISLNDKTPVTYKDLKRKGIAFCRQTYNNYKACHNLGSITNFHGKDLEIVDTDKYCYILFYSFCCQDLSVAGKQAGMKKGEKTRSGLLWEVERLLKECKEYNGNLPDVLILENVTQLHSQKNMPDFQEWINFLNTLNYTSYYEDINSKYMGVPQNRDRTFMVSILGQYDFNFPKPIPLKYCMADVLEDEVDEKYFINNEKADKLIEQLIEDKKIPEIENE